MVYQSRARVECVRFVTKAEVIFVSLPYKFPEKPVLSINASTLVCCAMALPGTNSNCMQITKLVIGKECTIEVQIVVVSTEVITYGTVCSLQNVAPGEKRR